MQVRHLPKVAANKAWGPDQNPSSGTPKPCSEHVSVLHRKTFSRFSRGPRKMAASQEQENAEIMRPAAASSARGSKKTGAKNSEKAVDLLCVCGHKGRSRWWRYP